MSEGTPEPEKEVPEVPEEPEKEVVPEAVEDSGHESEIPEWGQRLQETVNGLTETVNGLASKPEEALDEGEGEKPPGDGDVISDESPAKPPWHKRGLFA